MGADGGILAAGLNHRGAEAQRKTEPVGDLGKGPAVWLLSYC